MAIDYNKILDDLKAGKVPSGHSCGKQPVGTVTAAAAPAEGEKSTKVHLKARSRAAMDHWYWGACVHDLATVRFAPKIALDLNHDHAALIGHARPSMTDYGIELDGVVVDDPKVPEASKVAAWLKAEVPLQASIEWRDYQVEYVPEGVACAVNGESMTGPLFVFHNWTLAQCAICPQGVDNTTESVAVASADSAPAPKLIERVVAAAPVAPEAQAAAPSPEPISAPSTPVEAAKAEDASAETPVATPEQQETAGAPAKAEVAPEAPVEAAAVATAESTATSTPVAEQATQTTTEAKPEVDVAALQQEIAELRKKLAATQAGSPPVPVTPADAAGKLTWAEALDRVAKEGFSGADLFAVARKRYPQLAESACARK